MTVLVYHPVFLEHKTGLHPECPERLAGVVAHLKEEGLWERCEVLAPRAAGEEELTWVHTPDYVERVRRTSAAGGGALDFETPLCARTFEAARHAVGAGFTACDAVSAGEAPNALCLVRPPGHHACSDRGMGFCTFNNVALAARYLQRRHGKERVLIVDFDVHHGNGTQEAFYEDPTVHYLSLHRAPFYPGSGWENERGRGAGLGSTTNIPLRADTPPEDYHNAFTAALARVAAGFRPDFVLVSAGFDGHRADPIAGLNLEVEDFARLTRELMETLAPYAAGGLVSFLEGGYHLEYLPRCVAAHLRVLMEAGTG